MEEELEHMFFLEWESVSCVNETYEPDAYNYVISGNITVHDEYENRKTIAGRFKAFYCDIERARDDGISTFDVFDAYENTLDYHAALLGRNSKGFSNRLDKLLDLGGFESNVLIIDRLELLPKYRGRRNGLSIMRHIEKRFAIGVAVIAIKPYPLQFESKSFDEADKWQTRLGLKKLSMDKRAATKKLRDYYGQLGYKRLPGTEFMVKAAMNTR